MRIHSAVVTAFVVSSFLAASGGSVLRAQNPPSTAQPPAGGRATAPAPAEGQRGRRASPPQPQQQQGVEYFVGTWSLEWLGRESPISTGPRMGTVTFTRQGTTNVLNVVAEGKTDAGSTFKDTGTFEWDPAKKLMTIKERLSAGVDVTGVGNWGSPLSIMYEAQPIQVKGQSLRLRRTYSILSAVAFEVMEEMSTNGGRWERLGNGEYTKKQ